MSELRSAFARLRRSPGFVLGASFSLAIGISLATGVFAVVHAVLGRPLGVDEPERLGVFTQVQTNGQSTGGMGGASVFVALREQATAFAALAAYQRQNATFGELTEEQTVPGIAGTHNLFDVLRVRPMLGRGFEAHDEGQAVTVLSHSLWSSRFGADTTIIGKEIEAWSDGVGNYRVLGVMPPTMEFPIENRIWFLLPDSALTSSTRSRTIIGWQDVIARLKPGVSFKQASAQVSAIYHGLVKDDALRKLRTARLVPLRENLLGYIGSQLALWTGAAMLVLLLCAVNFATMSLARGMRRRGELAVRAAMGASKAQLVRVLIVEAMLISVLGGIFAALAGWWLVSFANVWFSSDAMPAQPVMDLTTMAFAVGGAIVVGFIFAAAPALDLARVDLRSVLQGDAASSTSKRGEMFGRRALVALQMSMALMAVACVAALVQADRRYRNYDAYFDYEPLVLAGVGHRNGARTPFDVNPIMEVARSAAGVEWVAARGMTTTALVWNGAGTAVDWPRPYITRVTPNLFDAIGARLIAGRMPTAEEVRAGDAIMISASMAQGLGVPAERAAGLRLRMKFGRNSVRDWYTIYGVVPDLGGVGWTWMGTALFHVVDPRAWTSATLVMRVSGEPKDRLKTIAATVNTADARLAVHRIVSAKLEMAEARATTRGRNVFLGVTTALALVLAIVGVYGLTSYSTELRLREFGIRVALGASTPNLARNILSELWWMAAIGIGVGLVASSSVTKYLDDLYRQSWMREPLVTLPVVPAAVCAATLALIAVVGTAVPLRRVLRMDVIRSIQGNN
jgi:predicted permease